MMKKVIEKATGTQMNAKKIEGGYEVYTLEGELYKKLRESTFKKYFKEAPAGEELTADKREKMVAKVKKMMALAENNPSEEEALAAALQAQKLMLKYNIHEDEVSLEEIKDEIDSVFSEQKHNSHLHKWRFQLAYVVAKSFRCKTYIQAKDVVFRGYREDAKLALEVYLMLYSVGNKLGSKAYNEQFKETGSGKGAYTSITCGFLFGVRDAFNEQCKALMVITPKEVEEEFEEFSAGFKTAHTKLTSVNKELFNEGYEEGKKSVKSRSIEG